MGRFTLVTGIAAAIAALLFSGSAPLHAQNREIRGRITDSSSEGVIGAGILVQGTASGTVSDEDGNFHIQAASDAVLEISALGYVSQTVGVEGRQVLEIVLETDINQLEKVVVVGYGTRKVASLTTAVSTIDDEQVKTTVHSSLAQRLQGKVSGLNIRQQSGAPGSYDAAINIRGFGTPLIIVDGVVRLSAADFQKLNPEDIESISVLKDGAAAIYGMNAANGVILVTTKRGSKGRASFSYDASFTLSSPTDIPEMADAWQFAVMKNEANTNVGLNPIYTPEELAAWKEGVAGHESTDWYSLIMKDRTFSQQHTLSASGGTDAVKYYVSAGWLSDPGLLRNGSMNYDKYTVRSNLTAQLTPNLKAEVDISGFYEKNSRPATSFMEIIRGAVGEQPMHHPYANDNPEYPAYVYDGQVLNPVALSDPDISGYWRSTAKSLKTTANLIYEGPFTKGLTLKGTAFYEHGSSIVKNLVKSYKLYSYDSDTGSYPYTVQQSPTNLNLSSSDGNGLMLSAQVSYDRTFAQAHHVAATGVYEQRSGWSSSIGAARDFSVYLTDQLQFGDSENQRTSSTEGETGFKSLIGRVSYDDRDRYILEYAFRRDGSYRYHPDHRWGFFPVYSAAWRMSEEPFMKKHVPFVSNLKLRLSYGIVGEDAGAEFQYVGGFTLNRGGFKFSDSGWTAGAQAPGLTNEALTWYTSEIKNLGVDFSVLDNALSFSFDLYQRDRSGLLATRGASLPNTFGTALPQENLNKDRIKGLEVQASFDKRVSHTLRIYANANFNFARTMTVYAESAEYTSSMNRWRSGQIGRWNDIVWMYEYAGQFASEEEILSWAIQDGTLGNGKELVGDFKYKDQNGDGVIDGNDLVPIAWNGSPKFYYGLTLGTTWKNLDFNMLWQGSGNYTVRFSHYYATMLWNDANMPAYFFDRYHRDDDGQWIAGTWPAIRNQADVGAMYSESNRWRKDATYLRLKSLSLGWTIPQKWLNRSGIKSLRLSANAYNLLTICDPFVKPFDPEKIEGLYSAGWVYPLTRSFSMNVNISF